MNSERARRYLAYLAALSAATGLGQGMAASVSAGATTPTAGHAVVSHQAHTVLSQTAHAVLAQSAAKVSPNVVWGQCGYPGFKQDCGPVAVAPAGESLASILQQI